MIREQKLQSLHCQVQIKSIYFELSNELLDTFASEALFSSQQRWHSQTSTFFSVYIATPRRIQYLFNESTLPCRRTVIMVERKKGGRTTMIPQHQGRQMWRLWYGERRQDACREDLKKRRDECRILHRECNKPSPQKQVSAWPSGSEKLSSIYKQYVSAFVWIPYISEAQNSVNKLSGYLVTETMSHMKWYKMKTDMK